MSYPEFLVQPYNLLYVGAAVAGLCVYLLERVRDRDHFRLRVGLFALAVAGLTLNGAVHDLALGDPGARFPWILGLSLVAAALSAWGLARLRARFFPPVERVRFNEPDLQGVVARVVSRRVERDPGSGRAHWHDGDGGLHVVRCHTDGTSIGFGKKVRLESFDDEEGSYLVSTT